MATKESDILLQQMQNIVDGENESPSTTTTYIPFSTLDSLNMQSQAWANTDPDIATAYKNLASGLGSYSSTANTIADFYNTAAKQIADREGAYANASFQLANQLNQDLANQRDYVWSVFGPEGSLTTEMNKYYDEMGNYLASEGGRQMAKVAAQGLHSGASLGLLRAQENAAYNNAFQNYLKVKEQEINAKQKIQTQLIDYMTKLRQEYGNTTNQYILAQYQRANDLLNKLSTDLASQYTTIGLAKLQGVGTSGSGTVGKNGTVNGTGGSNGTSNGGSNGASNGGGNGNVNSDKKTDAEGNIVAKVTDANESNSAGDGYWSRFGNSLLNGAIASQASLFFGPLATLGAQWYIHNKLNGDDKKN